MNTQNVYAFFERSQAYGKPQSDRVYGVLVARESSTSCVFGVSQEHNGLPYNNDFCSRGSMYLELDGPVWL